MTKTKRLLDEYRFPGFRPIAKIKGKFGDSRARIISLERQKKQFVVVGKSTGVIMTARNVLCVIYLVARCGFIWNWKSAASSVSNVGR
jgi:hypothetical protein